MRRARPSRASNSAPAGDSAAAKRQASGDHTSVASAYLYCYYRVEPAQAAAARGAVADLFRAAEEAFGAETRLLRGEREPFLWMEAYEKVRDPERLESMLAELCMARDFAAFLAPGERRRNERFVAAVR